MIEMLRTLIEFATPQTAATQCAFPSPAEDHQHPVLHIGDRLVKRPPATFFFTALGDGMEEENIYDGDTLIVDRSVDCHHGCIVIAVIDGDYYIRRLERRNGEFYLCGCQPDARPIKLADDCEIFGRVMWVVRQR